MTTETPYSDQGRRSLGVTSNAALQQQRMDYQVRTLELSEMLNRKLDLSLLLECFFVEVQAFVRFDGMLHRAGSAGRESMLGSQRQHTLHFSVSLGSRDLGELVFYRSLRFSPREDRELERLVGHLGYPLRNALDYHLALQTTLTDKLTGMPNLRALRQMLPREILLAQRGEVPLSLLMLDLDHFKALNSHHGHRVGDDVLRTVAETLLRRLRKTDMIFRSAVDRFAILLYGTEYSSAKIIAERIRTAVDRCYQYDNIQLVLHASAGITEMSEADSADAMFDRAAEALLNAKRAGRNTLRAVDAAPAH